jgi:predicted phosphodiesterase
MKRYHVLPGRGPCVVMTDVHGNGEDFRRVRDAFLAAGADAQLVVLGDIVHAPSEEARGENPALYDYADESGDIALGIGALHRNHPGRVHFVLGNHDYGRRPRRSSVR